MEEQRMRYTGNAVLTVRCDRRVLAALAEFYLAHGQQWVPQTKSGMVKQALEDFAELLEHRGVTLIPQSVRDADIVLERMFGGVTMNVGRKGEREYLREIEKEDRLSEATGRVSPMQERRDAATDAIKRHLQAKAQELGYETIDEMVAAGGKPKEQRASLQLQEETAIVEPGKKLPGADRDKELREQDAALRGQTFVLDEEEDKG